MGDGTVLPCCRALQTNADFTHSAPQTLGVNLFGVINGSNAFVGSMVDNKEEAFVLITGSKQGITCPPGNPSYNVSKAGVKGGFAVPSSCALFWQNLH